MIPPKDLSNAIAKALPQRSRARHAIQCAVVFLVLTLSGLGLVCWSFTCSLTSAYSPWCSHLSGLYNGPQNPRTVVRLQKDWATAVRYSPRPKTLLPRSKTVWHLTVMAMFKNEAHIMREWLEHYQNQGVEHFLLINNNSSDTFANVLRPFQEAGVVTLVDHEHSHSQVEALNIYLRDYLLYEARWVAVVDLDEFIFATTPNATIASVIRELESQPRPESLAQICIPWITFGSSGYERQPRCVVQSFLRRAQPGYRPENKCIVRVDQVKYLNLHNHLVYGSSICPDGSPAMPSHKSSTPCPPPMWAKATNLDEPHPAEASAAAGHLLRLNHYAVQAADFFETVKAARGDATSSTMDRHRNWVYFRDFEEQCNAVLDTHLAVLQGAQANVSCHNTSRLTEPFGHQAIVALLGEQ